MCISLGLNWLLMLYFAIKLHRWKAVLYPVMFTVVPFLNWIFMVYGIFTAGQRTWGGPRADAGAADAKITPQEAIERAIATGDDLNVVPETFRPAIKSRKRRTRPSALLPSSSVEGRFVSADHEPQQSVEKGMISPSVSDSDLEAHPRRFGHDSLDMSDSEGISIHTPQRVTSLSGDEGYIAMQGSEHNSQNRPTTYPSERGQRTTGPYHSAESTATVIPLHQRREEADSRAQSRSTVSSTGPADPHELTRHLSQIVARQTAGEGPPHLQDRSPLGRISPLTALPIGDDLPGWQDGYGVAEGGNDNEAEHIENHASKRNRLRKREAT
jgi:chitin synthase